MLFWQLAGNAVVVGCHTLLLAVTFSLVFNTARFFHFAHAGVYTLGAYLALLMLGGYGLPFVVAFSGATIGTALAGIGCELLVYRPLRKRGASQIVLLLASIGLYLILENAIALYFGNEVQTIRTEQIRNIVTLGVIRVTNGQIALVVGTVLLTVGLGLLLKFSRAGVLMRAVASSATLADAAGIPRQRVLLWTMASSSALAGAGGVLTSLDVDLLPHAGFHALMLATVSVVIGGRRGIILGAVVGSVIATVIRQTAAWFCGSLWQDAVLLIVMLMVLYFCPRGFVTSGAERA